MHKIADRPLMPTLLFDGGCRVCSLFARMISWWDARRRVRVIPFQQEEARALIPDLPAEEVRRSAHLVLEDGEVLSGSRAIPALLDRLHGVGSIHRRIGHRLVIRHFVRSLYGAGVALRNSTRCATAPIGARV